MFRYVVTAVALLCVVAASSGLDAQAQPPIWQGVYTDAQAVRGKQSYDSSCIRCHGADLVGVSAPALKGERFMQTFGNGSVDQLFAKIRDTMPPNFGTSISDDAKIDVVSYILQTNGYPAGARELPKASNELAGLSIVGKGEQAAVRDFTLVQTVGCLAPGPNGSWVLSNGAEPTPTSDDRPAAGALASAASQALGAVRFRLLHAAPFKPAEHQGHKMEARGLIYKDAADLRLTLTSLAMVGTCPS